MHLNLSIALIPLCCRFIDWGGENEDNRLAVTVLQEGVIDPRALRYSQQSILPYFKNGNQLQFTVERLQTGMIWSYKSYNLVVGLLTVEELPIMNLVQLSPQGPYFSLDNRRLWVLQQYRNFKEFKARVRVLEWSSEFSSKFSTLTEGRDVDIRSIPMFSNRELSDYGGLVSAFQERVLRWSLREIKVLYQR